MTKYQCPHCGKPEKWLPWLLWNGSWQRENLAQDLLGIPALTYSEMLQRGMPLRAARGNSDEFDVCAHCGEVVT